MVHCLSNQIILVGVQCAHHQMHHKLEYETFNVISLTVRNRTEVLTQNLKGVDKIELGSFGISCQKEATQCGDRTHDHTIKSRALYRLS